MLISMKSVSSLLSSLFLPFLISQLDCNTGTAFLFPITSAAATTKSTCTTEKQETCDTTNNDNNQKRDISSLPQWILQNDIKTSGIALTNLQSPSSDDYGITLATPQSAGSTILTVPKSIVLDSKTILREWRDELSPLVEDIADNGFPESTHNFVLLVKLLYENALAEESRWYAYLRSLPANYATGVMMNDVEISVLPPYALALANYEKQKLEVYRAALKKLSSSSSLSSPLEVLRNVDWEDGDEGERLLLWAYNVVTTRCWRYGEGDDDQPIIVPVGDMFNHRDPPNVMVRDEPSSAVVDFVLTEDSSSSETPDQQLHLDYGRNNPYRLLILFGFCDESMPQIYCEILFPNAGDELIRLGCDDRSAMVYDTADGSVHQTVKDVVLYTLLAQVPAERDAFYRAHEAGDATVKGALHAKYALEVSLAIGNHVRNKLKELEECLLEMKAVEDRDRSESDDDKKLERRYPHWGVIGRHLNFLWGVFDRVRTGLDEIAQVETKKRRANMKK